jgi:hypothetical protein
VNVSFSISKELTDLVIDPKVIQDLGKCVHKHHTSVQLRNFNNVQEHCHGPTIMLQVNGNSDIGSMIQRGPSVGGKVEFATICLAQVSMQLLCPLVATHLQHLSNLALNMHKDISDIV